MIIQELRLRLRADLESPEELRQLGSGWLSGTAGLVLAVAGLFFVLCLRYPGVLTIPQARPLYSSGWFRLVLHSVLIGAFGLAVLSLVLRTSKVLGFSAIAVTMLAGVLGGSRVESRGELTAGVFLGLDWFVINVLFTGILFIPIERLFAHRRHQPLFREDWREDLFYYLVSSLMVQVLTFLSMAPANAILAHTKWAAFRHWVGSQPVWVQLPEIMFFTDVVQYFVHRAFHRVPWLWKFHAVHHSARSMDWMAGARMHFLEILVLRGFTVIPMYVLGFGPTALHLYILLVYVHSTFVHANVRGNFDWVGRFLVTPRFHHWHHGIEPEAIDVNFAIHFPLLDRVFGTFHLPPGKWPEAYGIGGHPVPRSYLGQFLYPFTRQK
jgi:sterol desaturase/sphingolipid hydroxylase (fatty acid hydroxylase superfamily)